MKPLHLYIAGGALALAGTWWLLQKGNAQSVGAAAGSAAVGAVVGVVSGATNAAVDAANNPSVNPLQPFGAWIGATIYDVLHPAWAKP